MLFASYVIYSIKQTFINSCICNFSLLVMLFIVLSKLEDRTEEVKPCLLVMLFIVLSKHKLCVYTDEWVC